MKYIILLFLLVSTYGYSQFDDLLDTPNMVEISEYEIYRNIAEGFCRYKRGKLSMMMDTDEGIMYAVCDNLHHGAIPKKVKVNGKWVINTEEVYGEENDDRMSKYMSTGIRDEDID